MLLGVATRRGIQPAPHHALNCAATENQRNCRASRSLGLVEFGADSAYRYRSADLAIATIDRRSNTPATLIITVGKPILGKSAKLGADHC